MDKNISELCSDIEDIKMKGIIIKGHEEFISNKWSHFVNKLKEGDELWYFNIPSEYWRNLMGSDGFIILRGDDKKEVAKIIFRRS